MDILSIILTAIAVSVLWFFYLKFYKKDNQSLSLNEIKEKEHQIELTKLQHEKELSVLKEQLNSLVTEKTNLQETLSNERITTAEQLKTLGKVDALKIQ